MATPTAVRTALSSEDLATLRTHIRGELIAPADAGYDEARAIHNGMIDRHPALIARCTGVADIRQVLALARERGLEVAVRGGGHSVAGNSTCDDGIVIDLSPMQGVHVDPVTRTARVQGGVTYGAFDHECHAFGLATTGGVVSTTGVAGLTQGGGLGWLMRSHGLACDNLLAADVVTADGQVLHASDSENPDLFWALRGGGGNFGVVTSLDFRLHPVSTVFGGMILHPIERASEALRAHRAFAEAAPRELTMYAGLLHNPDGAKFAATVACYAGPPEKGEALLRPLREHGTPAMDTFAAMPYPQMQTMLDAAYPKGLHSYWRSSFLDGLSDEVFDTMVDAFDSVPSPLTSIVIEQLGGAVADLPDGATAYAHRSAPWNLLITSQWDDPERAPANIDWTRTIGERLGHQPNASVYVNYLGAGDPRAAAAYGESYDRLRTIKARYDPENVFHHNQNIPPAGL